MDEMGIYGCIDACGCPNRDTAKAIVSYYVLESTPNSWAEDWYEGSYASALFPEANMDDWRISEFLMTMGSEEIQRSFYGHHIGTMVGTDPTDGVPDTPRMTAAGSLRIFPRYGGLHPGEGLHPRLFQNLKQSK